MHFIKLKTKEGLNTYINMEHVMSLTPQGDETHIAFADKQGILVVEETADYILERI